MKSVEDWVRMVLGEDSASQYRWNGPTSYMQDMFNASFKVEPNEPKEKEMECLVLDPADGVYKKEAELSTVMCVMCASKQEAEHCWKFAVASLQE